MNISTPSKFLCLNPTLVHNMMVLGGEAFGHHEGDSFTDGMSAFTKETPESSLALSHPVRTQPAGVGSEPRGPSPESDHAGVLILDVSASRAVRNTFVGERPHQRCW